MFSVEINVVLELKCRVTKTWEPGKTCKTKNKKIEVKKPWKSKVVEILNWYLKPAIKQNH